ncbi:ubiquinol-cytochrome C reductase complex 14kD subunit [Colletotrichum lupini]|uniref:Complex III subunit 7 n=1 Tax=Colletotrichum lupini TaxID=145971 RepID=A0A9Q8SY72_9PEZI|nr:ubiquinol-cytochrome C reductase complex 14kD subunit [Colletotrichum lupini]UQC85605.1 ubiquinol-cytochrome C reductase complex 14kD subunit [Colletotrichum lupini]
MTSLISKQLADGILARPFLKSIFVPFSNWYANAAGHRKLGLRLRKTTQKLIANFSFDCRFDDLIEEETDIVQKALKRLSPKESYDRVYRIRRAVQLSYQHKLLPKNEWTKPEEDYPYLGPIIQQIQAEEAERLAFETMEEAERASRAHDAVKPTAVHQHHDWRCLVTNEAAKMWSTIGIKITSAPDKIQSNLGAYFLNHAAIDELSSRFGFLVDQIRTRPQDGLVKDDLTSPKDCTKRGSEDAKAIQDMVNITSHQNNLHSRRLKARLRDLPLIARANAPFQVSSTLPPLDFNKSSTPFTDNGRKPDTGESSNGNLRAVSILLNDNTQGHRRMQEHHQDKEAYGADYIIFQAMSFRLQGKISAPPSPFPGPTLRPVTREENRDDGYRKTFHASVKALA